MPYGGNDWLALTQEPILEPELPICDAHHHFWDYQIPPDLVVKSQTIDIVEVI